MRSICHLFVIGVLCAAGLLTLAASLSGCGSPTPAARYDRVFPDDRVLTVRIVMKDKDWQALEASPREEQYYRADIWIDGEPVPDVAVRPKGNSSLMQVAMSGSKRVSLKVDLNFFNSARTYHGIKKLNYNNGFSDPTFMKEFLGYELMAQMGVPTPRACFVDLWVNDTHMGLYTQVEQVDSHFLAENFRDSGGNLYKPELAAGPLRWTEKEVAKQVAGGPGAAGSTTSTTVAVNIGGGELEKIISRAGDTGWIPGRTTTTTAAGQTGAFPGGGGAGGGFMGGFPGGAMNSSNLLVSVGLKTNENSPDYSGLFKLLGMLNQDAAATSAADLERVLDVDECLRFLAVSTVLVHLDNYTGSGHNYYLYEAGGRFSIVPWDLNMSLGGFDAGLSRGHIIDFYIDEPTSAKTAQYPLAAQLLAKPEYLETYHGYLTQIVEGPFSVERMMARIEQIAKMLRPYVAKDDLKFFSAEDFERGLTDDLTSGVARTPTMGGTFIGLMSFVTGRDASISAQLSGQQPAKSADGNGNGGVQGIGRPGGGPGGFGPPGFGQQAGPGQPGVPAQPGEVDPPGQ